MGEGFGVVILHPMAACLHSLARAVVFAVSTAAGAQGKARKEGLDWWVRSDVGKMLFVLFLLLHLGCLYGCAASRGGPAELCPEPQGVELMYLCTFPALCLKSTLENAVKEATTLLGVL